MAGASVGCNAVMSPGDVEPWADPTSWAHLLPATHSAFLPRQYSSGNFGSVNIHYGAIFLQQTVKNGHTLHLQHTKKLIDLTNVDIFSPVYVYRINIRWQISLHQQFAELVGSGLKTSRISSWQWDGHDVPNLLTHAHRSTSFSLSSCSVARWWWELFYTAGKWAWPSRLIFNPG